MKIAVVSDTHFGDEAGTLVCMNSNRVPVIGPRYPAFKKAVQERFMSFYRASLLEIDNLNRDYGYAVPTPARRVIFGHTHQPIPWNHPDAPKADGFAGHEIRLFNTGGWLNRSADGVEQFVGAEVFIYSTRDGVRSVSIR